MATKKATKAKKAAVTKKVVKSNAANTKAVKSKAAKPLPLMKKVPQPKWAQEIDNLINAKLKGTGHSFANDPTSADRYCSEGAELYRAEGDEPAVALLKIWHKGYNLAIIVERKKKATKNDHGLHVKGIYQRNLKPIPKANYAELASLAQLEGKFCGEVAMTLRMNKGKFVL